MSLLASTMSMFDEQRRKNGQSRYIACSSGVPSSGRVGEPGLDRRAEAVPARQHQAALRPAEHPGDRAQVLDAPRVCLREAGRLPMFSSAISPIDVDSQK